MGLLLLQAYNSISNLLPPNNTFKLENDDVVILEGAYELSDLNDVINNQNLSKLK